LKPERASVPIRKGARYRENFRILLEGGSHAFVQVGALIPERQKGGIRMVINPAKFSDGDAAQINLVMRRIIGREYDHLMRRPLINCIDFAVDIQYASLSRMLVSYSNAQRVTVMAKRMAQHCHIEGYNYGSVTSVITSLLPTTRAKSAFTRPSSTWSNRSMASAAYRRTNC
jgi:hypothetical protein